MLRVLVTHPETPREIGTTMAGPITPEEAADYKRTVVIPEKVFEAFNELIATHWNGRTARFRQDDVVRLILKKYGRSKTVTRPSIFANHWLDVEPIYREAGWKVVYDSPAYNETYDATFEFSKS